MRRRKFIQKTAMITGGSMLRISDCMTKENKMTVENKLTIDKAFAAFEREPLIKSYGFKGGYITRLWQVATKLQDASGTHSIGLGIQSPLWSDSKVTAHWGESGSNALMYSLTNRALQMIKGQPFDNPIHMTESIIDELHSYGVKISNNLNLRKTFALNALVSVDNAAWLLYAKQNDINSFDELIPKDYKLGLSYKHNKVASIPSISYSTSEEGIKKIGNEGYYFIKIKIGAPGTQQEMLEKDKLRMNFIQNTLGAIKTKSTETGKIYYYLDANGRYESKDLFKKLLDHCKKIGAFNQIIIVEEPFPENLREDVSDIDVRIAADESAHTDKDALDRMEMGYSAMALKPVAKTLSMTIKIAQFAHDRRIPCLCADLTVNPLLVDWNKSVAARLEPLPGLDIGLLETNGHQNYKNWNQMIGYHPKGMASWNQPSKGTFHLDDSFYKESAGMFLSSKHYNNLFE